MVAIPVTSTLPNLSIERTAKLVQNLIDLKNERNIDLPDKISSCVNDFLEAQQNLTEKINHYLHRKRTFKDDDNIEVVTAVVETCPEFLATKGKDGSLPCHLASLQASDSAHKHLLLFARIGLQYNIGGKKSRGGLLCRVDITPNSLHMIRDPKVFDVLQKHDPPLFYARDVQNYHLLHSAVLYRSLNQVKYLCNLDSSCLYQLRRFKCFPIGCAIRRDKNEERMDIIEFLLHQSVSHDVSNETIGGLFTKRRNENTLTLDALVEKLGREDAWECIERALSTIPDLDKVPLLCQTIRHAPQYCSEVINRFPSLVHVRDPNNNNRRPIHVALETGMKFSLELNYLILSSQEYLRDVDPVTKWPPFVLAAISKSCDLRTIYSLLHQHPEHVEMWRDGCVTCKYIPVDDCKRRRMNE